MKKPSLVSINNSVIRCTKCPCLYSYTRKIAKTKVKRFLKETYWGKPLPSFGDPNCTILIVGLAPAAHGGNRTGRLLWDEWNQIFAQAKKLSTNN
jgi:uracil-DNA glycosylase